MENADSCAKHKLLKAEENRANPSKFYSHFFHKALMVSIFLVIFSVFPSQAPEFINQTLFTRSWELLHFVFVGIAVSYGLFCHRKEEMEKEINNCTKFDNAQTYVSRFLQVSSVLDDENENLPASDENKFQTWSNQYYRNEPMVVVAKDHTVLDQEQRVAASSRIGEKPLLLPVRSLKYFVSGSDVVEPIKEFKDLTMSSSNSDPRRFSSNSNTSKNEELGGFDEVNLVERLNENVVLPSPVPWKSRSGRIEMKEDVDSPGPRLNPLSSSMEKPEFSRLESRSLRAQMPRSNRPDFASSSPKLSPSPSLSYPKKLSPSPSLSLESEINSSEDSVRKKSFYRPSPIPRPPPPMMHKSSSIKVSYVLDNVAPFEETNLKRGFTAETKESSMGGVHSLGKSVRTMRSTDKENDQALFKTEQLSREIGNFKPNSTFMQHDVDSDIEYDDEHDDVMGETPLVSNIERSSNNEETISNSMSDEGPDVDKKADEFIAKFREQIRLQRIESIKRSSAQIGRICSW